MKHGRSQQRAKNRRNQGQRRGRQAKPLRVMHANAAGIDVGSQKHWVAVPPDRDEQPVRSFGCLTKDLHAMGRWLKDRGIETVAMESTGVYWIPVMQVLEEYGLEVALVDARQARNVPGRKTDVKDCQWLAELHTYGLLSRAFRPSAEICVLRSYWRHRKSLVEMSAMQIQWMQKSLEQMNLQLHKVLSDITGVTGMAILRAIVDGQRDPMVLAEFKHGLVKQSTETIAEALRGDWRAEHLFTLRQALELYDVYQEKIRACDDAIEAYMASPASCGDPKDLARRTTSPRRKNQAHFDLRGRLYELTGVDLTRIDGIDALTAQTIVSECGFDMSRFASEKHYASWLGLCPNHEITGGKVRKRRTRKVCNRATVALRVAAQSLHRSKTALGAFFRRMRARHGSPKAITATARKLAVLIYRMFKYGMDYVDQGQQAYEQQYQQQRFKLLQKQAKHMGYAIVSLQSGELVS